MGSRKGDAPPAERPRGRDGHAGRMPEGWRRRAGGLRRPRLKGSGRSRRACDPRGRRARGGTHAPSRVAGPPAVPRTRRGGRGRTGVRGRKRSGPGRTRRWEGWTAMSGTCDSPPVERPASRGPRPCASAVRGTPRRGPSGDRGGDLGGCAAARRSALRARAPASAGIGARRRQAAATALVRRAGCFRRLPRREPGMIGGFSHRAVALAHDPGSDPYAAPASRICSRHGDGS